MPYLIKDKRNNTYLRGKYLNFQWVEDRQKARVFANLSGVKNCIGKEVKVFSTSGKYGRFKWDADLKQNYRTPKEEWFNFKRVIPEHIEIMEVTL